MWLSLLAGIMVEHARGFVRVRVCALTKLIDAWSPLIDRVYLHVLMGSRGCM